MKKERIMIEAGKNPTRRRHIRILFGYIAKLDEYAK
jgi:hypothetical protein